jgi:hypothetical protein
MRPEISKPIRETPYPRLIDHQNISAFPGVVGMRKNVFWLNHDNIEGAGPVVQQMSHSNLCVVDTIHPLIRHIVRQGIYSSRDMAALTPYARQLQKLRAKMRSDFEIVLSERDQDVLAQDEFNVSI